MNISKILHQTAMEYSTFAKMAKAKGQSDEAKEFYRKAFELERDAAAKIIPNTEDLSPFFMLHRSAAALAYKAGYYDIAKTIIEKTLAKNPPAFIVAELKEIMDLVLTASNYKSQAIALNINGKLISADETTIEIEEAMTQQRYSFFVPKDKIKEIVKSFFSENVVVKAMTNSSGFLVLNGIDKAA